MYGLRLFEQRTHYDAANSQASVPLGLSTEKLVTAEFDSAGNPAFTISGAGAKPAESWVINQPGLATGVIFGSCWRAWDAPTATPSNRFTGV